jgi:hypothetical protein
LQRLECRLAQPRRRPQLVSVQGMRHGCAATQHRPRASPLRTELWFISYGLLGLTQNGLVPVLMPLAASHGGAAGLTYAAFSLLGVFAPFLDSWADRTGRHRDLLVWGTMSAGALLLLFDFVPEPLRILLAAGAGLGAMATTTAGNVLAIEGQSEPLWDARVALLQRYISGGQVIGLCAAGRDAGIAAAIGMVLDRSTCTPMRCIRRSRTCD